MNFQFEDKSVDIVNDQEYNKDELKEQSNDNQNKEFNQVESIGQTYEDFEKDYLNNSEVKTRFMENNSDMSLEEIQDELKSEAKMIYDTGLTDYSSVKSAVEMEKSGEYSHDYIVSAAQLSRNYDNSLFTDESNKKLLKAQETLQKDLETKIEKELKHKLSKQEKNKISEKAGEEAERAMQTIKKIKKAGN